MGCGGQRRGHPWASAATLPVLLPAGARVSLRFSQTAALDRLEAEVDDDADGTTDRVIPLEPPVTGAAAPTPRPALPRARPARDRPGRGSG